MRRLSHPARIRILQHLAGRPSCCCREVVEEFELAQSTVSQHLKILVEAGLVKFAPDRQRSRYDAGRGGACRARSLDAGTGPFLLPGRRRNARAAPDMAAKTVSGDSGSTLRTLYNLWPYMWPADRADLKARVVWATVLLVVAKLVLVAGSLFLQMGDRRAGRRLRPPPPLPDFLLAPVMLVIAYNVVRMVQLGFNQLRDALFARVGQHAVRQLAYRTFVHMHELSLRFHLERRTGGLSRIIERGTKGIETIVRFTMLATAPTILEFALHGGDLRLRLWLALCRR